MNCTICRDTGRSPTSYHSNVHVPALKFQGCMYATLIVVKRLHVGPVPLRSPRPPLVKLSKICEEGCLQNPSW